MSNLSAFSWRVRRVSRASTEVAKIAKWLVAVALCVTQASLCAAEVGMDEATFLAKMKSLMTSIQA